MFSSACELDRLALRSILSCTRCVAPVLCGQKTENLGICRYPSCTKYRVLAHGTAVTILSAHTAEVRAGLAKINLLVASHFLTPFFFDFELKT